MKRKDLNHNLTWYWYMMDSALSEFNNMYYLSCRINNHHYYHYENTINYSMSSDRTRTFGYFKTLADLKYYAAKIDLPIKEGSKF